MPGAPWGSGSTRSQDRAEQQVRSHSCIKGQDVATQGLPGFVSVCQDGQPRLAPARHSSWRALRQCAALVRHMGYCAVPRPQQTHPCCVACSVAACILSSLASAWLVTCTPVLVLVERSAIQRPFDRLKQPIYGLKDRTGRLIDLLKTTGKVGMLFESHLQALKLQMPPLPHQAH